MYIKLWQFISKLGFDEIAEHFIFTFNFIFDTIKVTTKKCDMVRYQYLFCYFNYLCLIIYSFNYIENIIYFTVGILQRFNAFVFQSNKFIEFNCF